MDGEIRDAVERLNQVLAGLTPYKLAVVDPRELLPADENAHYMEKATFDNLVENISKDGNLSSVPLCWKHQDGRFQILSGHHRAEAAVAAERPAIIVLYDDRPLPEQQRIAVQLSHNSLVGRDNLDILRRLWSKIDDLSLKLYSGLDETKLALPTPPNLDTLKYRDLRLEEISLCFIRPEMERAQEIMKALKGRKNLWLADCEDFDRFFDLLLDFKDKANIVNTSTAIKAMLEIVGEWLQRNGEQQ